MYLGTQVLRVIIACEEKYIISELIRDDGKLQEPSPK
jgi:hypothetical protein